jgi:hypothetical protein
MKKTFLRQFVFSCVLLCLFITNTSRAQVNGFPTVNVMNDLFPTNQERFGCGIPVHVRVNVYGNSLFLAIPVKTGNTASGSRATYQNGYAYLNGVKVAGIQRPSQWDDGISASGFNGAQAYIRDTRNTIRWSEGTNNPDQYCNVLYLEIKNIKPEYLKSSNLVRFEADGMYIDYGSTYTGACDPLGSYDEYATIIHQT